MSGKGNGKALLNKVLKFVGWFFLVIVLVVGVGALGAWMTGRFDPEKIYIQQLSINGVKEYVTITENDISYTTTVDFAPADANQLTLTAKILTGGDLIEPLGNVVAGQPLELKFKKDENGVTQGGEVEIKFIDSAQKAFTTLKVLIDVSLDSKHIEVTSNGNDLTVDNVTNTLSTNVLTTITKENANTIKISAGYDEMLNSYKGNWSQSENNNLVNLTKLKKMILRYKDDVRVNDFEVTEVIGDENYYLIKYLTPATTDEAFILDVYLYKTYFLESVFDEAFAEDLIEALENTNFERTSFDYGKLNSFINDYVYNNSSVDVKNNFDIFIENGLITLAPTKYARYSEEFKQAIQDTLNYVLASKRILITVDNIEVQNIVNEKSSTNLEFPVLQSYNYTIQDVNEQLGITLEGEEGIDRQVLFNSLRDLDITLCYSADATDYDSITGSGATSLKDEKIQATKDYFKVGTTYLKRVDETDKNSKFSITKNTADDGSVTWTLESLSPTHTSDKYYLLYAYTKNDFETKASFIPDGEKNTKNYEYNESDDAWYSVANNGQRSLVVDLDIIKKCYNRKYSCSPLTVTYTNGTIQYNTTTDQSGNNVINNTATTSIVLNEVGTIYKNEFYAGNNPIPTLVTHGSEGGVYYKGRDFSVGIRKSESDVMLQNVIIKANDITKDMEYTHVKWFVKYTDNVISSDAASFSPADNNRYYFKPVVKVKYDESDVDVAKRTNEIPALYRLKHIADNTFLGGDQEYFMEIGDENFTLEALNAMESDSPIPLYAVIIQTGIEGEPIEVERTINDGVEYVTLNYVAQTSDHTISTTQLVDKLNFYMTDSVGSFINATTTNGDDVVHNFLDVQQELSGNLYLTNFNLNSQGNPIVSSGDWTEEDKIVMQNAIDVERNYRIALTRFYNDFLSTETNPGIIWNYYHYDTGATYPIITPTISRSMTISDGSEITTDNYIIFEIRNNNVNMEGSWSYILSTTTTENVSSDMIFTKVSAIGYFKLSQTVDPAGSES